VRRRRFEEEGLEGLVDARLGTAFVAWAAAGLADILSIQEERSISNDNCVRYKRLTLQIPEDKHRRHYVKVKVHQYHDGQIAIFHGPRCLARYDKEGALLNQQHQRVA
jgi:hypothetical protein